MLRVLVVEDDPDSREILALLLEHLGHEVYEAGDGQTAIDVAARIRPDVALIDVGLPRFDGYEVAQRIRDGLGSAIRLVAVTAYAAESDREKAGRAGFDAHLTKSFDPDTLPGVLEPHPPAVP